MTRHTPTQYKRCVSLYHGLLAVLILLFIIYSRRRRPEAYAVGMDPDDDVRENMINYNEEGVGESNVSIMTFPGELLQSNMTI